MSEAMPWQPEQVLARGRFVLVKRLGRGGMGEVWLARDERLREPVALKFLPPEIRGDPGALEDLCRETARSHRLTHSNIVRIHDLYEDPDGTAFIVMEYVDGPTLATLRAQQPGGVLPWDYLRPLVAQLCAALEYAHGEKVIHRDLKPANLMVDSRGRLKLADFGIAAVASDSMSRVSMKHSTSGTLPYMSPQQLTGQRPQAADDIYALGATLYELLTGKPPFHSGDITHQVLNQAPEPMQDRLAALEIQNDIPPDAAALIMACLGKEPGQRPQSARMVAEWIGLELEAKTSAESLSAAFFPQEPSTPAAAAAGGAVKKGGSRPSKLGRSLAAVGIVALVLAAAFWLRKDIFRRDHSSAAVTAGVPVHTGEAGVEPMPSGAAPTTTIASASSTASGIFVSGRANPWLAGMPDGSTAGGVDSAPAESPVQVTSIPIAPGAILTFSATGEEAHSPDSALYGPPGSLAELAVCDSENGMAGLTSPIDALIGVFLEDGVPVNFSSPEPLRFNTANDLKFLTLRPKLRQPFFIGSGLTPGGVVQQFITPNGATRLFLGAMDTHRWNDNVGGFTVTVTRLPGLSPGTESTIAEAQPSRQGTLPNPPATTDWRRGLVLYFSFDEAPKNGVVRDESGAGNNGKAVNVQWTAQGRRGGAVQFSRANSYITVSNRPALNPAQLTLAAWIKTSYADKVYRRIFDKGAAEGFALSVGGDFYYTAIQRHIQQMGLIVWQIEGAPQAQSTAHRVDDGRWHHLAATYDGNTQRLYLDGQLSSTDLRWTGVIPANKYDLTLGANRSNPETSPSPGEAGAAFDGLMDEVMMFNRALSAEEIRQLFDLQE